MKGNLLGIFFCGLLALLAGCGSPAKTGGLKIGLCLDTLREERWQHDRDIFTAKAQSMGAHVLLQVADLSDSLQTAQAENLITQGVQVLVVAPHNGDSAANIVAAAHRAGIKVVAYDRLINNSDLDYYLSFDNVKVGELQAAWAVQKAPKGSYVLIGGGPTDHNAKLLRDGQLNILSPLIKRGDIKIVADQWAKDWAPMEALKIMENALTQNHNRVDAVVASNDGEAGGAIQALVEQKLAGKVVVTGQDADLAACQRIAAGTQSMTVYKPIKLLAEQGAELAVSLAKGQAVEAPQRVNNGKIDVPSILLKPIAVDRSNLESTVIADGFHKKDEIFR